MTKSQKRLTLFVTVGLVLSTAFFSLLPSAKVSAQNGKPGIYKPVDSNISSATAINVKEAAERESYSPAAALPWLNVIAAPKGKPPVRTSSLPIVQPTNQNGSPNIIAAPTPT